MLEIIYMDLLPIIVGSTALILGAAIGWFAARWRFTTTIADLNSKLVLERRVNKQLRETVRVDPVETLIQAPDFAAPVEPAHEPMVLSG